MQKRKGTEKKHDVENIALENAHIAMLKNLSKSSPVSGPDADDLQNFIIPRTGACPPVCKSLVKIAVEL